MHIKHFRLSTRQREGFRGTEVEGIKDKKWKSNRWESKDQGKRGERERRNKGEAVSKEARKRKKWEGLEKKKEQ